MITESPWANFMLGELQLSCLGQMLVCRQSILKVFKTPLKQADDVIAHSLEVRKNSRQMLYPQLLQNRMNLSNPGLPMVRMVQNETVLCHTQSTHTITGQAGRPRCRAWHRTSVHRKGAPTIAWEPFPFSKKNHHSENQSTTTPYRDFQASMHYDLQTTQSIPSSVSKTYSENLFPKSCSTSKSSHLPILAPQNRPFLAR